MNICVKLLIVSFLLVSGCSSYKGDIDSIDKRCLEAIRSFESNDKQRNDKQRHQSASKKISTDQSKSKVLLLDGSLSMSESIDDTASTRADVAKATVLSMLKQQDDGFKIYSFGNVNDDCVNNIAELNGDNIKTMRLGSPIGRTPIVQSILNILEQYQYENKLSITVITDGIDNCDNGNNLEILRNKIQALNDVELTIDIVGMDIPEHHSRPLREIAALSNGRFTQVDSAISLQEALLPKEAYGFIEVDRPIEVDAETSWRLYNKNNQRVAHFTDISFAFNEQIKIKPNSYDLCLIVNDEIFVSPVVLEAGEIHRIKSLRRQRESKSSVLQAIKEAINVFK